MERLSLARLQDDQASPGVSDVGTVPPSQLVFLILYLQSQCVPGYPVLSWKYQISAQDILSSLVNIRYQSRISCLLLQISDIFQSL